MSTDDVHEYRSTKRALAVVDAAREVMAPEEIAVALGISSSTMRMWKQNPETAIAPKTARQLRRLERRLAK